MVRKVIITLTIMLSSLAFSQGLSGVYQLEIEDLSGGIVSKGTGFLAQDGNNKAHILTSFHLINAKLIEAHRISIKMDNGDRIYLKIAGYDELNDILALSSEGINDEPFPLSSSCNGDLNVAGYHDGKLIAVDVQGAGNDPEIGPFYNTTGKLPVYLTRGFSGAPVLNIDAGVCGMVVLSSEMNASSVAVSHSILNDFLSSIEQEAKPFSVRELRFFMGVERIVRTQEDLDSVLSRTTSQMQLVINIIPRDPGEGFLVKGGNNAIIEASGGLKRLVIHRSNNIMVRGINIERLIINESSGITVEGCTFDQNNKALFLKDSKDIFVSKNVFRNIDTGVVLKSSQINLAGILNGNSFEFVKTKIQNI